LAAKNAKNLKNDRAAMRPSFAKVHEPVSIPNLLSLQIESFDWLIGNQAWRDIVGAEAKTGLEEIFEELSPIEDSNNPADAKMGLAFANPELYDPAHTPDECKIKGKSYTQPLYIKAEFTNYLTGEIKSQTVFMGDFPVMTDKGTFIINGTERVVVSQLVRSPGVYFSTQAATTGNLNLSNTKGQIIPSRGSYLEFLTEWVADERKPIARFGKPIVQVQVDRKTKVSATIFLKALGLTREQILDEFKDLGAAVTAGQPKWEFDVNLIENTLAYDESKVFTTPIITKEDALRELYRKVRGEAAGPDTAEAWLRSTYFDQKRYNLARVGRHKLNRKLGLLEAEDATVLTVNDIVATLKYLLMYDQSIANSGAQKTGSRLEFQVNMGGKKAKVEVSADDIDDFSNRRIRSVGELIQNQVRIGLSRMERVVRERMSTQDIEAITPQTLINLRPVVSAIKEFFGASQLSQFMDQNNPLAGLAHMRRLSALGPGGIARERAQMEVRDVHPSHYGRMCPVETPEGPNIGLIGSLTSYARINTFGFIETPYNKVVNRKATGKIEYLDAAAELGKTIAAADADLNAERVIARYRGEVVEVESSLVDYIDVSQRQLASVSTSLIPFLEHDDSSRALMGANMQRQAVPLVRSDAPFVGTGMERVAAFDSGAIVINKNAGVVESVSADAITVLEDEGGHTTYTLRKFERSNQGTAINQRAIVQQGDRVEAGVVLADGPSTDNGELALGKNLLVAFMPWEGHNFEDAIIISQNLVKDDTLSSIHIEEYEVDARTIKLGDEEITRDLPNIGLETLSHLDDRGIIRVGAEVRSGDILVGKVTPKGETELTPEERLLRAIFADKGREVRESSLKVPHGEGGTVIGVKVFATEEKAAQLMSEDTVIVAQEDLGAGVLTRVVVQIAQKRKITEGDKLAGRHGNKGVISKILPVEDMPFLEDGTPVDIVLNPLGIPGRMNFGQVLETHLGWIASHGWDVSGLSKQFAAHVANLAPSMHAGAPGTKVATPVFDGASKDEIVSLLEATLPNEWEKENKKKLVDSTGKATLFDGRSGEKFPAPISVGYMYVLKLHHLVDDKIHARSTGPYSMITQQPLGGKAQFGGQRFGEMEVWALQAYGAAHTLQELLTIKSDDISGRIKTYEAIVTGQNIQAPGIPESFRVLAKEMQSLALNIEVLDAEGNVVALKDEDDEFQIDRAAEEMGINLSRDESLAMDDTFRNEY